MPYIISVLLFVTHGQNTLLPINTFCFVFVVVVVVVVDAMFISSFFYLVLLSFSLASIQLFHPTHGLFFLFCVTSLGSTHFPSCSSHTVNTFF